MCAPGPRSVSRFQDRRSCRDSERSLHDATYRQTLRAQARDVRIVGQQLLDGDAPAHHRTVHHAMCAERHADMRDALILAI